MLFDKPSLPKEIMTEIFTDVFRDEPKLKRAGVVGSYARGGSEFKYASDVDIVLDYDCKTDELLGEITAINEILEGQFIRHTDFIHYADIVSRVRDKLRLADYYKEMLNDLMWLYERAEVNG